MLDAEHAYNRHFESIADLLPVDLARLKSDVILEDGHLKSLEISEDTLVLQANAYVNPKIVSPAPEDWWKIHITYISMQSLRLVSSYENENVDRDMSGFGSVELGEVDWIGPDMYAHRIRCFTGIEIEIQFGEIHLELLEELNPT